LDTANSGNKRRPGGKAKRYRLEPGMATIGYGPIKGAANLRLPAVQMCERSKLEVFNSSPADLKEDLK
jgi:hypothetical protein